MSGINCQMIVCSSINNKCSSINNIMFKNRTDNYLVRAGYT